MPATSTLMRIARPLVVTQAVVTGSITGVALVAALVSHHDDVVARRAGNPNVFEGLGTGIALFVAVIFGAVATMLVVGAVGLFRRRGWGRIVVGLGEAPILLVALWLTPSSLRNGGHEFLWTITALPAGVVLAAVVWPTRRTPTHAGVSA